MEKRATLSLEVVYLTLEAQAKSRPIKRREAAREYPRILEAFIQIIS